MTRTLSIALLAGAIAASSGAQTLDEIIAKNIAARGGAAAWRAVRSMSSAGTMELGQGMLVPFRLELKRPQKMRLEFDFDGQTAYQTYDGTKGWKLLPYAGHQQAVPLSHAELTAAAAQVELDGALIDYAAKGYRVELEGREAVEGRATHRLALTLRNGARRWVYVDVETGLEAQIETPYLLRGEQKRVATQYRDFRQVGRLMLPHLLESRISGAPRSHKLTITSVELNVPLSDARFGQPSRAAAATPGATRSSGPAPVERSASR